MDSILESVKRMLMIGTEDRSFDPEILMHINAAMAALYQLGLERAASFHVNSEAQTWGELLEGVSCSDAVPSYVYLRVKQLFDPSASSTVAESQRRVQEELEWRIYAALAHDRVQHAPEA